MDFTSFSSSSLYGVSMYIFGLLASIGTCIGTCIVIIRIICKVVKKKKGIYIECIDKALSFDSNLGGRKIMCCILLKLNIRNKSNKYRTIKHVYIESGVEKFELHKLERKVSLYYGGRNMPKNIVIPEDQVLGEDIELEPERGKVLFAIFRSSVILEKEYNELEVELRITCYDGSTGKKKLKVGVNDTERFINNNPQVHDSIQYE